MVGHLDNDDRLESRWQTPVQVTNNYYYANAFPSLPVDDNVYLLLFRFALSIRSAPKGPFINVCSRKTFYLSKSSIYLLVHDACLLRASFFASFFHPSAYLVVITSVILQAISAYREGVSVFFFSKLNDRCRASWLLAAAAQVKTT